jgi:hypothetical protein
MESGPFPGKYISIFKAIPLSLFFKKQVANRHHRYERIRTEKIFLLFNLTNRVERLKETFEI